MRIFLYENEIQMNVLAKILFPENNFDDSTFWTKPLDSADFNLGSVAR